MDHFSNTTTLEKLQGRFEYLDSNIIFKSYVISIKTHWQGGCLVAIYKAKKEKLDIETELELVEEGKQKFADSGSAIEWALTRI